ncbi:MAG: ATP-binding cassette domain-containing protein [Treponema sp.]|nr:ATP-binding cassette domain-containing protein [Treponema sp.]
MTIEVQNLSKKYPLKTALDSVSARFESGKIHALLGENGAGKSTLAAIISGSIPQTDGTLLIDGKPARFERPRDALSRGIVIVQQRPLLAQSLTARENIILQLSGFPGERPTRKQIQQKLKELDELRKLWAPNLPLAVPVQDLGGNQRFYVAFLGALLLKPQFLILDEPSAFLDMDERMHLYEHLRVSVAEGLTVLVITHSNAEAETYADTVTMLTKGRLQARYESPGAYRASTSSQSVRKQRALKPNKEELRSLSNAGPKSAPAASSTPLADSTSGQQATLCFSLDRVSCRPKNKPALLEASLEVHYGEITAVTGLKEAALDTLEDLVTGLSSGISTGSATFIPRASGSRTKPYSFNLSRKPLTARFLRQHRTAIVPSDRTFRASNPALTISQMLSVYLPSSLHQSPDAYARELITRAGVSITPQEKASNLSGGMMQRLILMRELSEQPDFIIFCNPLQGLDKNGQQKMTEIAVELASQGKAVLIIGAADFPLSLCRRVYALESGICRKSFPADQGAST